MIGADTSLHLHGKLAMIGANTLLELCKQALNLTWRVDW